jgi:pimeloyl-ACP methyl ester carboxylesterase
LPEKETVGDPSQGVQLATVENLARYWATDYDWRKVEARLNALPNFMTTIDGLDIHFIHARSKHENALPLIVTHGWPGSVIEQLKIIDPLIDPTAHGGQASDAFHVVIPSIPGFGFSGKPTEAGWDPAHIAKAWVVLMKRLGYDRFAASGGDWGAMVSDLMGAQAPPELVGIHLTWPFLVPPEIDKAVQSGSPLPANLSAEERLACERLGSLYKHGLGYAQEMSTKPQSMYAIADSPVGLAAWMLDHDDRSYALITRVFNGASEGLTRDDVLDNITLFWLTNTAVSSARIYWENKSAFFAAKGRHHPGGVQCVSRSRFSRPRETGQKRRIPISSSSRSTTRAATLPRGNSRRFTQTMCAQPSDRCGNTPSPIEPRKEVAHANARLPRHRQPDVGAGRFAIAGPRRAGRPCGAAVFRHAGDRADRRAHRQIP